MTAAGVVHLGVDLVADHVDVFVPQQGGQGLQMLLLHHRAGGVVGEGEDHGLGFRRDGLFQLRRGEAELVLGFGLHDHRLPARQPHQRRVADEAGLVDDDFVPGPEDRAEGQVDGLAAAHGDQNLLFRVVGEAEAALLVGRDLPPQL